MIGEQDPRPKGQTATTCPNCGYCPTCGRPVGVNTAGPWITWTGDDGADYIYVKAELERKDYNVE